MISAAIREGLYFKRQLKFRRDSFILKVKTIFNKTDYDFHALSSYILITGEETLLEKTVDCLRKVR